MGVPRSLQCPQQPLPDLLTSCQLITASPLPFVLKELALLLSCAPWLRWLESWNGSLRLKIQAALRQGHKYSAGSPDA